MKVESLKDIEDDKTKLTIDITHKKQMNCSLD